MECLVQQARVDLVTSQLGVWRTRVASCDTEGSGYVAGDDCSPTNTEINNLITSLSAGTSTVNNVPTGSNGFIEAFSDILNATSLDMIAAYMYCDYRSECTEEVGSYSCACLTGYTGTANECLDIDECSDNTTCDSNAACANSLGSYECTCDAGYSGTGSPGNCSDIDECTDLTNPHSCADNATCTNNPGSYDCACDEGWTGDGFSCANIDECAISTDDCHANATCFDTEGSYTCTCIDGYTGNGTYCADIDECTIGGYCDGNATCVNTVGSFACSCNDGYQGTGLLGECIDINECVDDLHPSGCHANASCTNTPGSNTCMCIAGFEGDGFEGANFTGCSDVDECALGTDDCGANSFCNNTEGSFTCTCNPGFTGIPTDGCTDIDECTEVVNACDEQANCTNNEGSYTCACNAGYSGTGYYGECADINECLDDAHPHGCDAFATCNNTVGGNTCMCPDGFTGDGYVDGTGCTDLDECADSETTSCAWNAECSNNNGSYTCTCPEGYTGDGTVCIEPLSRCNITSDLNPDCAFSNSTSCDFATDRPTQASTIFEYFRYFFKVPETIQVAQCDATTTTTSPVTTTSVVAAALASLTDICDAIEYTGPKISAYTDTTTLETVELFHYNGYFQWFDIGTCVETTDSGAIGCVQRYVQRPAITIRRYSETKYQLQIERVWIAGSCEVSLINN